MSYERELEVALAAAREAGAILLRHYKGEIESWEKSEDNPVTAADLESDKAIRGQIAAAFPDDGILSEETIDDASRLDKQRVWIVDPMDGTKEFTQKIPEFAASIAMIDAGEPVVGVILNPVTGVAIWASKGAGCFKDGEPVRVTGCTEMANAVVIASRTEISRDKFAAHQSWFAELRPVGSIAWKLACVAAGDADLNVSFAPKNEWDVAAGDVLVREAGGSYVDFEGQPRIYNQANPLIEAFMAAGPTGLVETFCEKERARS